MTVSPSAETCRNMADSGCSVNVWWIQRAAERAGAMWSQRAQPAAQIMEEKVQSLKEGARRSQAG